MTVAVEIMTPERLVLQTEADSVVVPAADGELGILPGHVALLAGLQPGQIRLKRENETELFAVSGGFVQVRHNRVVILAETAEMAQEIDVERARQAAEKARAALRAPSPGTDLALAEAALHRALARLRTHEILTRRGTVPRPHRREFER